MFNNRFRVCITDLGFDSYNDIKITIIINVVNVVITQLIVSGRRRQLS